MKIGIRARCGNEEHLAYAAQLGAQGASIWLPAVPGYTRQGYTEARPLIQMCRRFEVHGLALSAAGLGTDVIRHHMQGQPEGQAQLDNICRTVMSMGEAGIGILIVDQRPTHFLGSAGGFAGFTCEPNGRGGARLLTFDGDMVPADDMPLGKISREHTWECMRRFYGKVLPVAEKAGVKLATHPDDPPLLVFRGVEHAPHRLEGLARLVEEFDSPNNGLLFCIGTMAEAGEDVIEGLRRFAQRGQIFYVHYRNVRGTAPHYQEVFQDEGDVDMVAALRVLKDVGFDGWVVNDHEPMLDGDTRQWSPRSLAWQVGYIRGVLQSVG